MESEIEVEDPETETVPDSRIVRLQIKYLSVGTQIVQSNGQSLTIPGVEESLRKALQQRLEDETEIPAMRPQIVADLLSNSLILEGSKSHVEWMEKLLQIWDRPLPLIRIEAHLFETSEIHSRQLGLEFRAKSVSADGTVSVADQGAFSAGLALGPAAASQALRVDAVLRLLQSEGKGRMLSRPVVVTLNNVEAEMNSGSVLHIKIVNDKTSRLQELKTGITLRVTPRLIEDSDNHTNDKIWLKIYAETSNPTDGSSIDGIPPINTQRAQTQVFVKNGQAFLLGGLIKSSSGQSQSGLPFFKDLPLLGPIFRTSGANNSFDHVMVFVTPTRVFADTKQQLPLFSEMEKVKKTIELKP
jgi:type III secretion protein C